jgi:hypothetical protein
MIRFGIMRRDGSSAFVFDMMEPERPKWISILEFVKAHKFHAADFVIRADGVCRINPALAGMWRKLLSDMKASDASDPNLPAEWRSCVLRARKRRETKHRSGEDNVDSPPFRLDGFTEPIEVNQLGDVSLDAGDIVPNGFHCLVKLLLATTRDEDVGPSSTKSFAAAKPIPVVPPVMTATFPCVCPQSLLLLMIEARPAISWRHRRGRPLDRPVLPSGRWRMHR